MHAGEIKQALKKLNKIGTVLYVAAHPDDENTRLLSYLANERQFRTVYLSITRGDGGQNLIGDEKGDELGMIRTRELMAARNIDGAEQFFTRACDFGYSKSTEETFRFWNRTDILADVVFAIRKFRPDVIIDRFSSSDTTGHGHHTASAMLALEAFHAAADPKRFPEQLTTVSVWQAKRIFLNSFIPRGQPTPDFSSHLKIDVGAYNPLLGVSYGELAAESRSMHKSQGFGVAATRGSLVEYFKKLDGDTTISELFQGIDTTWRRVKGAEMIPNLVDELIKSFDPEQPEASLPALSKLLAMIRKCPDTYWSELKAREVIVLMKQCSGLYLEVNSRQHFIVPGDTMTFTVTALARLTDDVRIKRVSICGMDTLPDAKLVSNKSFSFSKTYNLPSSTSLVQPYWLSELHEAGAFAPQPLSIAGAPWNKNDPEAIFELDIAGQGIELHLPVTHKSTDPVLGEQIRQMEVVPAISIKPANDLLVFTDKTPKLLLITVEAYTQFGGGFLEFQLPGGWHVSPDKIQLADLAAGQKSITSILITPPEVQSPPNMLQHMEAKVSVGEIVYNKYVKRIEYSHIPPLIHLCASQVKLVRVNMKSPVRKIGYLEGAGDEVAECLRQAGFEVTSITPDEAAVTDLSRYETIVTGVRAFNTIENVDRIHDNLMRYVEQGGNLVVQYNTSNFISTVSSQIGPFPFKITRDRVTDETTPAVLVKEHYLLTGPNKIDMRDFDGWVQERGLYFAGEADSTYEMPISWNDPGEAPLKSGLIVAKKGKGYFIYTGISFFRQLPAGVPGAYRLFCNLINAGKK